MIQLLNSNSDLSTFLKRHESISNLCRRTVVQILVSFVLYRVTFDITVFFCPHTLSWRRADIQLLYEDMMSICFILYRGIWIRLSWNLGNQSKTGVCLLSFVRKVQKQLIHSLQVQKLHNRAVFNLPLRYLDFLGSFQIGCRFECFLVND